MLAAIDIPSSRDEVSVEGSFEEKMASFFEYPIAKEGRLRRGHRRFEKGGTANKAKEEAHCNSTSKDKS